MSWARIRESIGKVWGATTTLVLSLSVAVLPVLQGLDPDFVKAHPALMWASMIIGIVATVMRVIAPPPPHVTIHADDHVTVDHDTQTVTVAKVAPISAAVEARADVVTS